MIFNGNNSSILHIQNTHIQDPIFNKESACSCHHSYKFCFSRSYLDAISLNSGIQVKQDKEDELVNEGKQENTEMDSQKNGDVKTNVQE